MDWKKLYEKVKNSLNEMDLENFGKVVVWIGLTWMNVIYDLALIFICLFINVPGGIGFLLFLTAFMLIVGSIIGGLYMCDEM